MRPIVVRPVLAIYIVCFAAGAFNHTRDFIAGGWRPYAFVPPAFELFYTALLPLDLAVAGLLLAGRRRSGVLLAAAVMLLDVGVNASLAFREAVPYLAMSLVLQTLFLGFVLGSIAFLWPAHTPR